LEIWLSLSGVIGGLCVGLIAVAARRLPRTPIRPLLYGFLGSGALWIVGDLIATLATSAGWKQAGLAILYTGAIPLPALWWRVALRWADDVEAGLPLRAPAWRWAPLGWAGSMWLVMITNPWHGAFLTPVIGGRNVYEPLWYAMALPNYSLILASLAVGLAVGRRVARQEVRRQAGYMIMAAGFAVICNALYTSRLLNLNTTVVSLSISSALLLVGMAREGLFGVLPAAFSAIAAGHPDGLVVVGPDRRVRYANRRAHELLAPFAPSPNVRILDAFVGAEWVVEDGEEDELGDELWWERLARSEGMTVRMAGSSRWLHLGAIAVYGRGRGEQGYCLRIGDATARMRAELSAAQKRRLESVASLARTVSRDFQGVLAVVQGNAEMLAAEERDDPRAQRMLSRILEAARHGADVAHQLQIHTGTFDATRIALELAEIVEETCGVVDDERPEGVTIVHRRAGRPLPVEADPIQIRHCIFNVLENALEATARAGGEVRVSTGAAQVDPPRLAGLVYGRDEAPGDFAYVEIRDEGGGMTSETEERAFEPYFSTRGKDRGTGLSAVLGIARAHGAPVTLVNERGRGCTFTLYFPLAFGEER
jgi:signal transduction histidine kinase